MYKILGADGKEYGPLSAEQVKKWIAENRVEPKTPVFPEDARDWVFLMSLPEFADAFAPPPAPVVVAPPVLAGKEPPKSGWLIKIIPYKNPQALAAYYLGVFAVIPFLGVLLGIAALALGVGGLRRRKEEPEVGGSVHAWIGIIAGGLFGFIWLAVIVLFVIMTAKARNR
jgi:hypothetical protein